MHFRRVCLESFGYTLPDEVVTTAELERRLSPLYQRLRLPEGRLELMTGIRERRFFPPGTRSSSISVQSARQAIENSGIDARYFGALIHGFANMTGVSRSSHEAVVEIAAMLRTVLALPVAPPVQAYTTARRAAANAVIVGE